MPQVPTYGQAQVQPTVAAQHVEIKDFANAFPDNRPDMSGLSVAALKYRKSVDEARVNDKLVQLRRYALERRMGDNGFLKLQGENALLPDLEGRGLAEREEDALKARREELAAELSNPMQRSLFMKQSGDVLNQQYAFATQHHFEQDTVYQNSVDDGAISQAGEAAFASFDQPDVLLQSAQIAREHARRKVERQGLAPADADRLVKKAEGSVYVQAIEGALAQAQTNPALSADARGILNEYGKYIPAKLLPGLSARVNQAYDDFMLTEQSEIANNELRKPQGSYERLTQALFGFKHPVSIADMQKAGSEVYQGAIVPESSAGRQFIGKDGQSQVLEIRGKGISQLDEDQAREAANAMGEHFDPDRFESEKSYNNQLGLSYYNMMLQRFGGDAVKATAAYHAGADAVETAIKNSPDGWLLTLGTDTQNFVEAVQKRFEAGHTGAVVINGQQVSAFDPRHAKYTFKAFTYDEAERYVLNRFPRARNDRDYCDTLVARIMHRQSMDQQDHITRQTNIKSAAVEAVLSGKDIPQTTWAQMDYQTQKDFTKWIKAVQMEDTTFGDDLYAQLAANPDLYRNLSDEDFNIQTAPLNRQQRLYLQKDRMKARAEADAKLSREHYVANGGALPPDSFIAISQLKTSLKNVAGFSELSDEDQTDIAVGLSPSIAQGRYIEGHVFKHQGDVDQYVIDWTQQHIDIPGLFGSIKGKNVFNLKVGDLPNNSFSSAAQIVRTLAKADLMQKQIGLISNANGNTTVREPTEGEMRRMMITILTAKHPPMGQAGLAEVTANPNVSARMKEMRQELPPGVAATDWELIKIMLRSDIERGATPVAKPTQYLDDDIFGEDYYGLWEGS